jgi:hypothetical protein
VFKKMIVIAAASLLLMGGCAANPERGPTYPVVGTVDQKEMEKAADAARITYYALISIAAEYTDLPRCTATQGLPCSSQAVVNAIRTARNAAGTATKGAVALATSPTKTPLALANAVADAKRALDVFKDVVASVRPEAKGVN